MTEEDTFNILRKWNIGHLMQELYYIDNLHNDENEHQCRVNAVLIQAGWTWLEYSEIWKTNGYFQKDGKVYSGNGILLVALRESR